MSILIASTTTEGTTYDVTLTEDGVWMCACKGWLYSKKPAASRSCRHLRMLHTHLGLQLEASGLSLVL
jgi:hypothetical protein